MNQSVERRITNQGWVKDEEQTRIQNSSTFEVWVKRYILNQTEVAVKACVYLDNKFYPNTVRFESEQGDIVPNRANRATKLKGRDRIICCFDLSGYMQAIKSVVYKHKVSSFKQKAKQLLYENNSTIQ